MSDNNKNANFIFNAQIMEYGGHYSRSHHDDELMIITGKFVASDYPDFVCNRILHGVKIE